MLLDGENFEDPTKNILFLLSSMIGNPVALYYSNLTCCASTTQDLSDFVFEKNVEKYKPDIVVHGDDWQTGTRNILQKYMC